MRNPYIFFLIMLGVLAAGFFIGQSGWFNDWKMRIFGPADQGNNNNPPAPPANGTACTMPDGSAGTYNGGVCVKTIGIPVDENSSGRMATDNSQAKNINYPPEVCMTIGQAGRNNCGQGGTYVYHGHTYTWSHNAQGQGGVLNCCFKY
jgi:hypothetical protein